MCIQNQLEWVEDPSNSYPLYWRNCIREVLSTHPELTTGIANIMRTCIDARDDIEHQSMSTPLFLYYFVVIFCYSCEGSQVHGLNRYQTWVCIC